MIKMNFYEEELYKNKYGIYAIINIINGKFYIGQTRQKFIKRYWNHRWKLNKNNHDNQHLQNSWNIYGADNFIFKAIESFDDIKLLDKNPELLNDLEIQYINKYRKLDLCFNIDDGGKGGHKGIPLTDEQKHKIAIRNRELNLGKKHSEVTKQKMSDSRRGKHYDRYTDILNFEIVTDIKQRLINGETAVEISKVLGVDYKLINNLIANNTWSMVKVDGWDEYRKNRYTYSRLTKDDHLDICKMYFINEIDKYTIAKEYNRSHKTIEYILRKYKPQFI